MKRLLLALTTLAIAAPLAFTGVSSASGVNYNNVISDTVFDNVGSMTASQIDTVLNKFPNSCISPANGYTFANPTGYYSAQASNLPDRGFTYGSNVTAGTVIANAAKAYDMNPQVLLATMQKEEGMVDGSGPYGCSALAFSAAMGYGCPDTRDANGNIILYNYSGTQMYVKNGKAVTSITGTCVNSQAKVGFSRQVINAAWLLSFDRHRSEGLQEWHIQKTTWDNSNDLSFCYTGPMANSNGHKEYRCPTETSLNGTSSDPYVSWSGQYAFDGTAVTIANGATAALYHYTPHTHGQYLFYNAWTNVLNFGSTQAKYVPLKTPRWMEIENDGTYKLVPGTTTQADSNQLSAGQQVYFDTKIVLNGITYLRTQHDTDLGLNKGIVYSDLEEVPVSYTAMKQPRWLETKTVLQKVDPVTGNKVGGTVPVGVQIYFPDKFDIGNDTTTYLRTQHDADAGITYGIPLDSLTSTTVQYVSFQKPRWMQANKSTAELNLKDGKPTNDSNSSLDTGSQRYFDHKIVINGVSFVTNGVPSGNSFTGTPLADLGEIPFTSMKFPRTMVTTKDTSLYDPITAKPVVGTIPAGTEFPFSTIITVNNISYLRSDLDTKNNLEQAVPIAAIGENYTPLQDPRTMVVTNDTYKVDPTTGEKIVALAAGTEVSIRDKTVVGSALYLRPATDSDNGASLAIRLADLHEKFVAMKQPRYLYTTKNLYKTDATLGTPVYRELPAGTKIMFSSKTIVNGRVLVRTEYDTMNDANTGILYSELR